MKNKIIHAIAAFILFVAPFALSIHGTWQDLTLGGILNLLYLTASQYLNPTSPKV
jgi:hypothetical protein